MRSQVVVPVVSAVLGGAAVAGALVGMGAVGTGPRTTVVQSSSLLTPGPVGGTAAGDVYRREAAGVVGVIARAVPTRATAFDVGTRATGGVVTGSGFVVDADGLVLTAAHLVRAASEVQVAVGTSTEPARVVGLDEANDLAVLRIDGEGLELRALHLADSDAVQVGDPAIAMGRAGDLQPTLVTGTVAARQPRITAPGGASVTDALQIDTPLHAADSGGPLLDGTGRVTGLNTRMLTDDGGAVELAVPANTLRRALPRLRGRTMKVIDG